MNKGLITVLISFVLFLSSSAVFSEGEIYKVVDADGNVTFTDQPPSTGAQPMDLPPLSVIETDVQVPEAPAEVAAGEDPKPLTSRELRRLYSDFSITQPQPEETFWGTGNSVLVTWGSSQAISPEMSVMLFIDGAAQKAPATGGINLTLDRGEHKVYAELRDERNRRIVTADTVTFFVMQHSVNFNRRPNGSG
jgi:hypothetical protein